MEVLTQIHGDDEDLALQANVLYTLLNFKNIHLVWNIFTYCAINQNLAQCDKENKVITNDSGVASSTLELKILLLR